MITSRIRTVATLLSRVTRAGFAFSVDPAEKRSRVIGRGVRCAVTIECEARPPQKVEAQGFGVFPRHFGVFRERRPSTMKESGARSHNALYILLDAYGWVRRKRIGFLHSKKSMKCLGEALLALAGALRAE